VPHGMARTGAAIPTGLTVSSRSLQQQVRAGKLASRSNDDDKEKEALEHASLSATQAVVNMAKGIVGGGMLALPMGLAAMKRGPSAVVPATLFLVTPLGVLAAYTYYLVAQICKKTGAQSYGAAWSSVIRGRLSKLMALVLVFSCGTGCVSYAMILGETLPSLLYLLIGKSLLSRAGSIVVLTLFAFYPLARVKNLASLGKFSLAGTLGNGFVIAFMALRYFQGMYAKGGTYPVLASAHMASPTASASDALILASILSTAFLGHFNAPKLYQELDAEPAKKDRSFKRVIFGGYILSGVLYAAVMAIGFLTFGSECTGNVLENYHPDDKLAVFAKLGAGVSIMFGHPLLFMGCKDNLEALIGKQDDRWFSPLLLALATMMAVSVENLGWLQALRGAVAGTFLCYTGPALMAAAAATKRRERVRHLSLAAFGVMLCFAGLSALQA